MNNKFLIDIGSSTVKVYKYDEGVLNLIEQKTFGLKKDFSKVKGLSDESKKEFIGYFLKLVEKFAEVFEDGADALRFVPCKAPCKARQRVVLFFVFEVEGDGAVEHVKPRLIRGAPQKHRFVGARIARCAEP